MLFVIVCYNFVCTELANGRLDNRTDRKKWCTRTVVLHCYLQWSH